MRRGKQKRLRSVSKNKLHQCNSIMQIERTTMDKIKMMIMMVIIMMLGVKTNGKKYIGSFKAVATRETDM